MNTLPVLDFFDGVVLKRDSKAAIHTGINHLFKPADDT